MIKDVKKTGKILFKVEGIKVYTVQYKKNHKLYCIKKIKVNSITDANNVFYELLSQAKCHSLLPFIQKINILSVVEHLMQENRSQEIEDYLILTEYCENNDLNKYIKELRKSEVTSLSDETLMYYLVQIIRALSELQRRNRCHRDIKPSNILLKEKCKIIKIADFGECTRVAKLSLTLKGSVNYLSPALRDKTDSYIKHDPYKSDVFSLGLTFLELGLLKKIEFGSLGQLYNKINYEMESISDGNFKFLLRSMLEFDEANRPDFNQLEVVTQNFNINHNQFCINCRNYHLQPPGKIGNTYLCETCLNNIRTKIHKCLFCKEKKQIDDMHILQGEFYCKICIERLLRTPITLVCVRCGGSDESCYCARKRCKVCSYLKHDGFNCEDAATQSLREYFSFKCRCKRLLNRQKDSFFYECNCESEVNTYCWVCSKSIKKDHERCFILLMNSEYISEDN